MIKSLSNSSCDVIERSCFAYSVSKTSFEKTARNVKRLAVVRKRPVLTNNRFVIRCPGALPKTDLGVREVDCVEAAAAVTEV